MFSKLAVACAAALSLAATARVSQAQKALVYCPVGIDAAGCDRIVAALQPKFTDGVDRGYDGGNGTVDLRTIDLEHYAVVVVPALADDDSLQPYALLRSVASRLHFAINGRVAVYSGAPDQGSANRADKDAIIQNLATWAAGGHTRATSLVGLVAFLDLSAKTSDRYSWVRAVSLADVSADAEVQSIGDVTAAGRGAELLKSGGRAIAFANMAANGLHVGMRSAGRTEVGALGGTTSRQSVLVTYSNADGRDAGNATGGSMKSTASAGTSGASLDASAGGSGPTLTTDKPDYLPGDTVLFSGTGWAANDTVTITIHEDPQWTNPDRTVTGVADGNGNLASHDFVVQPRDYGVTFTATAVGNPSGLVAQMTFTDGNLQNVAVAAPTTMTVAAGSSAQYTINVSINGNANPCTITLSIAGLPTGAAGSFTNSPQTGSSNYASTLTIATLATTATGSSTFTVTATRGANCQGNGNATATGTFAVSAAPNTPPVANNDTYGTNEDVALTVPVNGVLGNDTDAESNPLTAVVAAGPAHGTLTLNSDGSFTYTPAANFNGSDSFTYNANDGTVNSTTAATVTINVTAVNDVPSFTKGVDQTVLEDAGAQTVAGWATAVSPGPANENTQVVDFIVTNDNNGLFLVQPSIDATGKLTYTPAADANGSATVTVKIHDNGGTANGGVDTSAPQTFVINVTAVNDAPSFIKGADQTVLEDAAAQTVPGWATAISAGPANESSQTVSFVVTNNSNPGLFSAAPAVSPTGTLTFTPAANANGSATIKLKVTDNGGTANGGVDASAEQTLVINVTAVNDAPSFVKGTDPTVNEDAGAQTVAGWATSVSAGPADEAGQTLTFNVTTNTNAALFSVQPSVSATGTLTYTAAPNAFGSATITLTLSDNGGTANGGVDTSAPQTFTITVNPVNDVPSFTRGGDQSVLEDAGAQSVTPWATGISTGPPNESGQTISFIVTNDNSALFSSQPAVDAAGKLTYTSAPNANGMATVTVKVHDDGGTLNGGVDTSAPQTFTITVTAVNDAPSFTKGANQTKLEDASAQTITGWATTISAGPTDEASQTLTFHVSNDNSALFSVQPSIDASGNLTFTSAPDANGAATVTVTLQDNGGVANGGVDTSAPQMFTITITPVNDPPSFTKGPDQTVLEDAGGQSVPTWATGISAGPANENGQTVSFHLTSNTNPGLFSSGPAVASNGTLTFTGAPDANGAATITIVAQDNGGTAYGGIDTSPSQTFTITIKPVNDPPTFGLIASTTSLEDAGPQSVATALTNPSPGPANESGQTLSIQVTNDNNALFSAQPSIDLTTGALTYTTAANANGAATVTVTVMDNGGTTDGGVDHTTKMLTINVTPVNDAPSFTKGANQTTLEDAGPQSVAWATAISAGPLDESGQTLNFMVSNDNTALFSSQPAVSATGQLTYTAAPNANGSATVTIKLHDNGGTANGGVDTSPEQMFTITITPVNDAPSFTKGADQMVLEDAAAQTITGWATNISAGPADESGQAVDFVVSNNNTALFSVQPSVAANGTLTYTPAPDANGSATVTIHAHDDGGTLNGGVDVSADQTFLITVKAVNDAPSFTKGPDQTKLEDAGAQTVTNWATNLSKGPANESGQALTFMLTNDNTALFSSQPAVSSNGTLTYTAAPNANGSAIVSVVLKDDGGTADGGVDTAPTQTFTITITPVNDAPTFDAITSNTVLEDAGAQTVANAVANRSAGPPNESGQTLTLTVSNNNTALFTTQPAIDGSGTLTFTTAPNANGSAIVTVTLKDNGGTANGGVDQTTKMFTIFVTPVNDPPTITAFSSPLPPNAVNTSVSASGTFQDVDLGDVPPTESHTGTIDWGDGTTTAASIAAGTGTTRNFSGSHTYAAAGVYTLTATIKDAAGAPATAVYQYVVVYDPSAGFVTGGGWINSPAGACQLTTACGSATGHANFGFVSKYQKGANVPDGNTEFQFQAGGLNFKSIAYEWLVISGSRAQYKGTGTINGGGNYGFMLTAIDGKINGGNTADRFRIKIWDNNNGGVIVYDNQINTTDDAGLTTSGTLLGGGSISIKSK